ncbi:hypothetical protein [Nonomuraea sp. GTA35]|uniref:hypothetical protein n=1 Tax=Nonomuraea sp. GTA35 TaxID=1676746 RepID=UPI0035BF3D62
MTMEPGPLDRPGGFVAPRGVRRGAGSACRTQGGKVAPKYHTPRFMLVPQLRAELEVRTPVDRGPGRA